MPELWPFSPRAFSETLAFSTDIGEARSSEFRWSLHDALTTLQLSHIFTPQELLEARFLLRSNTLGEWLVPLWSELALSASIAADDASITVSTDADYIDGGQAFVVDAAGFEVVDIDTVSSGVLNLSGSPTIGRAFPNGALVMPLSLCLLPDPASLQRSFALEEVSVGFRRLDQRDLPENPFTLLATFPVLSDPSVIISGLSGSMSQSLIAIENGFGWLELFPDRLLFQERSSVRFADWLPADRWRRKRWLHYQRGADRPFWLPTWRPDFELRELIGATSATMRIAAPEGLALDALVGYAVQFRLADGTLAHSTLGVATVSGAAWIIAISQPGVNVPSATSILSLMILQRFATDRFELVSDQVLGYGQVLTEVGAPTLEVPL